MRADEVTQLPESRITNPFYASYITSFTRAVLAEILNALPPTVCVFSCTTDGFLCNASATQIEIAQRGELAMQFRQAREQLTGKPSSALEAKHRIRQPLGWRTRGQATLKPGDAAAMAQVRAVDFMMKSLADSEPSWSACNMYAVQSRGGSFAKCR